MKGVKDKVNHFFIEIEAKECKGCGKCVVACPKRIIRIGDKINSYGFKYAISTGSGCIGCGSCFYVCPEPSAITVYIEEENAEKSLATQENIHRNATGKKRCANAAERQ